MNRIFSSVCVDSELIDSLKRMRDACRDREFNKLKNNYHWNDDKSNEKVSENLGQNVHIIQETVESIKKTSPFCKYFDGLIS